MKIINKIYIKKKYFIEKIIIIDKEDFFRN